LHSAGEVATAPIRLFHHPTPTPTPTPVPKRSAKRSRPIPQESPVSAIAHRGTRYSKASPSPSRKPKTSETETTTKPKATPAAPPSPAEEDFPTAKIVPDKPGYVFSPYEPTKYVDVTGYKSGSKVKDPYSGKVFVVP
jgi:hypothetical protein